MNPKIATKIATSIPSQSLELSQKAKRTLKIIAIGVGVYVIYRLAKGVVAQKPNQSEVQSVYNELEALNQNNQTRQKITEFQAKSYANSIFTAIDGWGTDEEGIKQIFYKLQNNADFLAVSKAYGVREVSSGAWNPEPNFKGTMTSALKSELSADWVKILNGILKKKNITYRL